jgi:hypothetical protein
MTTPIAFGDIEIALADHLAAQLAAHGITVPVVIEIPATRPPRFVRVTRPGGSQSNLITDRPRIVAECWDELGTGVADLAKVTRALLGATAPGYVSGIWVDLAKDLGLAYLPHPQYPGIPRYLVTAELHVRGEVLA